MTGRSGAFVAISDNAMNNLAVAAATTHAGETWSMHHKSDTAR
jgi:hypothetical protein